VTLSEKGSDVGLSRGRKVFFCHGSDSRMTERAPSVEGWGEDEEEEEGK
jgi:hypothetical protein